MIYARSVWFLLLGWDFLTCAVYSHHGVSGADTDEEGGGILA